MKEQLKNLNADDRLGWPSASSADRDFLCPGSHLAQRDLPEPPPSPEADSGNAVHKLWTGTFEKGVDREPTPEEIDKAAELALREAEVAAAAGFPTTAMRIVETRLWHEFEGLKISGRFDICVYDSSAGEAICLDGKTGWLPVSPPNTNRQLRTLATLLWLTLSPQRVLVNILKPFGPQDVSCVYTEHELRRSLVELEERVKRSNDPKSPRIAGSSQCLYCRAAYWGKCPEHAAWLAAALPAVSPPLPMTAASEWTPEQRTIFCERQSAAAKWLEERKLEIKNLLHADPASVPGFGLREGRTIESVTDPVEVHKRFCSMGGKTEQFMRAVKIGKTSLKDEVRGVTDLKGKQLDAQLDDLLKGCTVSTKSAPTIEKIK